MNDNQNMFVRDGRTTSRVLNRPGGTCKFRSEFKKSSTITSFVSPIIIIYIPTKCNIYCLLFCLFICSFFQSLFMDDSIGSISIGGYTEEELEKQRQIREARVNGGNTTAAAAAATTSNNVSKSQQNIGESSEKAATNDNISQQDGEKVEEEKEKVLTKTTTVEKKPISTSSSNAFASSSTTNSFNVLTDRPTSKVTRPPGGHTQWSLG